MRVVVSLDARFHRTPDGSVWTEASFDYAFWVRYLEVFERVRVFARVRDVAAGAAAWKRVDGPHVEVYAIPYYVGPWQYLRHAAAIRGAARGAVDPGDAVILRIPSQVSTTLARAVAGSGRPYGAEVVSDPYEVFTVSGHPLRRFFRWWFTTQLRRQCAGAASLAYVTERVLQERYPGPGIQVAVSDVVLPDEALREFPRTVHTKTQFTLVTIGSLAQMYKGTDTLIEAVGLCRQKGIDLTLRVVGDGRYRTRLEQLARRLGVAERIVFVGHVPSGAAVREHLDAADLFVLPSRTEGLPRALVEAMARGLPCLGSAVGGIPELLAPEDLAPPDDAEVLASRIAGVLLDAERQSKMSARNLEKARAYREEVLGPKRKLFYESVRACTEKRERGK